MKIVMWGKDMTRNALAMLPLKHVSGEDAVNVTGSISINTAGLATEATLQTRASEATLSALSAKVAECDTDAVTVIASALPVGAASEVTLGTRATEATLGTRASEATLGTRASEATLGTRASEATLATRASEATLTTRLSEADFDTKTGAINETAPVSDTASSGLNGRLQRIAQRITSLINIWTTPAALSDAVENPTVGSSGVFSFLFNGTTWDRERVLSDNLTTGDTGAKTATGNGATQTNPGYKGVQIFIDLGTVSGTTPTCTFQLQGSTDGINFFNMPGTGTVTASLTSSVDVGIMLYPGLTAVAGAATTGTSAKGDGFLPKYWRIRWTIGGTTPSYTINAINYNYLH